ncbi:MAG TPA: ATP-binding protein [Kofleriaceae bacterium]|nr:ATP-binding protein [Kofleriaceae bacterium]
MEADAVAIVDVGGGGVARITAAARAACVAGDQVWIATRDERLIRCDFNARVLGESVLPASAAAPLEPAPCGAPAALYGGVALVDDFGELVEVPLADELTIPITGRRHVGVRGSRVTLPTGATIALPPGTTVAAGAVMLDGKTLVLATSTEAARMLVIGSVASGQLGQRVGLAGSRVRLATGRSHAIVQVSPRTFALIDLRAGRTLGSFDYGEDVVDAALDPDATKLVVQTERGDLEVLVLAEQLARKLVAVEVVEASEAVVQAVATPAPASAPAPSPVAVAFATPGPLHALQPRVRLAAVDRALARRSLERELRGISLHALCAIATAWDTRRLGYGNEGRHPYELEVSAILGLGGGFATDHVAAAREELAIHERDVAADPDARSLATPIGALIAELSLAPRAADILLVVAAASLHGEIARLYGIFANDSARPIVDELLVQQVLATRHDRYDLAAELDPRAPLVRLGIVQVSTKRARPFAELSIDSVILDRLRAEPPELGAATTIRAADTAIDELDMPAGVVERACEVLAAPTPSPLCLAIRGVAGSGRRALLAVLADPAGYDVAMIAAASLPRNAEAFVVELARSLRRAQLAGLLPCVVELDQIAFEERAGRDVAAEVLRAHPGPLAVVLAADAPIPFVAGHVAIDVPVMPETARRAVWQARLAAAKLDADPDVLAARYRVGPGVIRRAVAAAIGSAPATPAIDAFVRRTRDARLGQFARRVDRLAAWNEVVLPPDILDSLRELVARVRHRRTVFEDWGMGRTMATSRGLTALFQGQPGTGKTLVAGVVARELGLELYQVDLSKVMSKWIGETERNLATIFDTAEDGQVILLFDEADSLFARRTEVRSSNDRYANLEVNYLLQRLDAFEGIAVLTTNAGGSIDPAFKRRLSFRVSFPFPDEETREQLWRAHLPPELPKAGEFALDALARKYQLSGGYIRNACLRAAFLAAREEAVLHQHHLERAVALEFAELGKLSSGGAID